MIKLVTNLDRVWKSLEALKMNEQFCRCGAKTRSGGSCKKSPLSGKLRCRLHGGLSLGGKDHWNYKHGQCTVEARTHIREGKAHLKALECLARSLGMLTD